MNVDLAGMTKRANVTRRKVIPFPTIAPTQSLTSDLASIYLQVVRSWQRLALGPILGAYTATMAEVQPGFTDAVKMSDDVADLRNALGGTAEETNRLLVILTPVLSRWAATVERWHRGKWTRQVFTPTSVDLGTMIGAEDVAETLEAVVARNVSLVRSVSDEARARIADIVFRGFQARAPARDIAKELRAAIGLSRRRSLLIASDQTVKLSADLDTQRMMQAGITSWAWRHSGKLHYRPIHRARDGKVYTFTNHPPDMPGMLPYCGCKKQALLTL